MESRDLESARRRAEEYDKIAPVIASTLPALTDSCLPLKCISLCGGGGVPSLELFNINFGPNSCASG